MAGREKRKRRKQRERRRGRDDGPSEPVPRQTVQDAVAPERAGADASKGSKDDLARERLEALEEGERPRAVTVAAVICALLGLSNLIGWVAGIEVRGRSFSAGEVLPQVTLMLVAAVGMWRARYWAVLGFQAFLVLIMLSAALGLVSVTTVLQAVGTTLLLALSGTLFYFMVKALARIQMPQRRPPD